MLKKDEIKNVLEILEKEFPKWKPPVVSFMASKGKTPFEILISTLLSLRTKDETTQKAVERLFNKAKTPDEILNLSERDISSLIYPVGFYNIKAKRIKEISKIIKEKYNGEVPKTWEELLALPGVGRKTAALVLSEGYGIDAICVDTHVHRISNRLGWVKTKTPEETEKALMEIVPKEYWKRINKLFVGFGQTICRPVSPRCNECPINSYCSSKGRMIG